MADYQITLALGSKILRIPVMPEKLAVKSAGKNETATVLKLGEINLIRARGLREIGWSGVFPAHRAPFVTDRIALSPIGYVLEIEAFRKRKRPGRLSIYGTDLNVNMQVAIESFDYEERGGEVGDLYYSISLKEWKDYGAAAVSLPTVAAPTVTAPKARGGEPPEEKAHTVVKGDSLWAIAQSCYGDGGRYPELYAKNKSNIDGKNKGTGNPKYTIYPGQKLML